MANNQNNSNQSLIIFLHFAFFLTGITTVLIGQILPVLITKLSLTDEQAGQLFIAQFFGSFLGVFIFNYSLQKFGFTKTILFGLGLKTIAIFLVNSHSTEMVFFAFFLNGIGIGTTLPSINMLIAELNPLQQTSALNLLNFFWGIGAIICQPFFSFAGNGASLFIPTVVISALLIISFFSILFSSKNLPETIFEDENGSTDPARKIWKNPVAWMIAIFNFLIVAIESGLGGWLTTYSARFPDGAGQLLAATPIFFLFFVIGRGFAPVFSKYLTDNKYITFSLLILLFGFIIILFAQTFSILIIGASVLGFGTSATFPTNMARFTKFFGETATRNSTPIFILGSIGGASINWLIGYISTATNELRSGIFVLFGCVILMLLIQTYLSRRITN
jgi:FHS family glucose/mannose:H+ symporter-like MFS transporter